MITLTAEIICDVCHQVVASGEPQYGFDTGVTQAGPGMCAIDNAVAKARALGAQIGIANVTCVDCLRSKPTTTKKDGTQDARFLPKLKTT